jgi:hypothetical protein
LITDIQRKYLEKILNGEIKKEFDQKRYSQMMISMQKQIDKNMSNALWLVEHRLDVLVDEKAEIDDDVLERYRRFKAFAFICSKLNPQTIFDEFDMKDALKLLSKLYPKYYFDVVRKDYRGKSET